MMEENLISSLPSIINQIGHIQFSDAPGRTEPRSGGIDFQQLFQLIDSLSYQGYIGAEYLLTTDTAATLGWMSADTSN